ncbi:hypothetical protein [Sediminitomix flava]|uniref:Uncharacterized protein n=1 Tax=Sediminitomix flava TaxID=379075 RepID=A0A315Z889_SEDFL|nr:hypothetical protein [Sediminitomix flava]PWJ40878.1 hypothetical protein BC781_104138 [Sediminitomix flava]
MRRTSLHLIYAALFAASTLTISSCSEDDIVNPNSVEVSASTSANARAIGIADVPVGADKTFYKFNLNNGKSNWSDQGNYWLGVVADEKVREVYIYASSKHTTWQRVDPNGGAYGKGSFDVDAFLRNEAKLFNSEKEGLNVIDIDSEVYFFFGNRYAAVQVDQGEVFRESVGNKTGEITKDISSVDYLPFKNTYDFNGSGFFIGVTTDGYVAAAKSLKDTFVVPEGKTNSDVNMSSKTAGKVVSLEVTNSKTVKFTLTDGKTKLGFAQRAKHEFIKVD